MVSANTAPAPASTTQDRGSYITFKAGDAHFAISAQYVRYITAKTEKSRLVHGPDGKQTKIFEFDGQSVSCFEFSNLIGVPSLAKIYAQLCETLAQRKQDHINWLDALEKSLKQQIPFDKAIDPHLCAFGKWYDSYKTSDEDLALILEKFNAPHVRLHAMAEELLELNKINHNKAITILSQERTQTLHNLLALFDDAIHHLTVIQRPIALILEASQHLVALELDNIEDLITFDNNQLDNTQQRCDNIPMDTDFVQSFYQHHKSPLYLVIDIHRLIKHLR